MAVKIKRPASFAEAVMVGIGEVAESLDGGARLTERKVRVAVVPHGYKGKDVRGVREAMGASQAVFARFLGASLNTVRSWEQGVRKPSPMARRSMDEIGREPQWWRRRMRECVEGRAG